MKWRASQKCTVTIDRIVPLVASITRHLARQSLALLLFIPAQQGLFAAQDRPESLHVHSLLELRNDGLVRQQWDLTCGAAAVATLLTYQLGDPVSEREAAQGMLRVVNIRLVRARLGFSLLDLKRFAASRGYVASGYGTLTLDELLGMAPAIVPIRVHNFGHFVVVRGRLGDRLLLADPAFGNRTMTVTSFQRAWPSGVGFVVTRPGDPHPPNRMGVPNNQVLTPSDATLRDTITAFSSKGHI
jgi:predicted double-glycine peptidase